MWNFKNIKFSSLVIGILLTIGRVMEETGFDKSFQLLRFGSNDTYFYFNITPELQLIILGFMPYIFMRIWEAYYR